MLRTAALSVCVFIITLSAAGAAPVKARSQSGSGLLLLRTDLGSASPRLILYREPGMGRIAELEAAQLPQLSPVFPLQEGWRGVIVTAKKLDWYRIVYDNAEREGWLQGLPAYQYHRWGELLPGRDVAFHGGLRKDFYQLRSGPDAAAAPLATISREKQYPVLQVAGDWINVGTNQASSGWLRWRDENNRLLLAVDFSSASP